jgi:dienelactone hydrolase
MAEILLFHHARGLTPGVVAFADKLRAAGHTVHTPDLYDGVTFDDTESGVAHVDELGMPEIGKRATAAAEGLPGELVYAGMSMGCAPATALLLRRPGAKGAFFLYGATAPSWWDATWPDGVPSQSHQARTDPWREADVDAMYTAEVPGGEMFDYDATGHLFADSSTEDYDEASADLATQRILEFLAR